MKTFISICSARPNFVKLAAIHHAILARKSSAIRHIVIHTGQHYDPLFSDIFFSQLSLAEPDVNLGIHGGTRDDVIAQTCAALVTHFQSLHPSVILVYGDVNGAVGGALAAKEVGIPLAHIEAGLRSFDPTMPEELNRVSIDTIADVLFVSEASGMQHLLAEKVHGKAFFVGNTMIDTLLRMMPQIEKEILPPSLPERFVLATLHRPSNVDTMESLQSALRLLGDIAVHIPVFLPLHHRTRASLDRFHLLRSIPHDVHLIDPLGYLPFLRLLQACSFVVTDSGGIQEEATFLRKKCFTLRKNTERPVTIDSGSNTLIDVHIDEDKERLLRYAADPFAPTIVLPSFWDGKTGERIVSLLCDYV